MIKYSEKERQLINALHFGDFLNQEPAVTYRTIALHCFSKGLQGDLVESVRRCYNAMVDSYPYRLTKEFDDLIQFPVEHQEMTNNSEIADTIDWCIEMVIERLIKADDDIKSFKCSFDIGERRERALTKRLNHLKYLRNEILVENHGENTSITNKEPEDQYEYFHISYRKDAPF